VLRVPTDGGLVWLKATAHQTAFEVPLYALLTATVPSRVLHPIAEDADRGWLLLPDGGRSLADALPEADAVAVLEQVLPEYGALQVTLAAHLPALEAAGLDDMRPARMSERFDLTLELAGRGASSDDREALQSLMRFRPVYEDWVAELAASPVPASIDHNDLHAANILLPLAATAGARFYDWGDAVVSHPFASMLHGLGWLPPHLGVPWTDPRIERIRDAYLAPFAAFGSPAELVRTLDLACRVGKVARSISWARAIGMGDEARGFERAPLQLLLSVAEESPLAPF
jgi:hypothetical protein